jgi:RimJ/RimL family protein N-acetyltransferase
MTTLTTDRLLLRQFRESDLDEYAEMCADPEVMRYLGGKPLTRAEAWRHLAMIIGHWQIRGYGLWAAEERETGELIGRVGCWRPEGWPGLEVGSTLQRRHWGRGRAQEAARASLRYAFTELDQTHVISLINPENLNSIKLAERLGERYEGDWEMMGTKVSIYGIDRDEWRRGKRGSAIEG